MNLTVRKVLSSSSPDSEKILNYSQIRYQVIELVNNNISLYNKLPLKGIHSIIQSLVTGTTSRLYV